jgi:hypothetical protein
MAKEIKMKKAATGSVVDKKEQFIALANTGEAFGNELIELLSQYGCSFEGLVIETYAMSKAWAALQAIAHSKGYDAEDLFKQLLPSFMKDMEGLVEELKEEEKK